jgi:hypothetical protein
MNYGQLNAGNLNESWPQMGSEVTISAQLLVREEVTGEAFRHGVLGLTMTTVLLYMRAAAEQAEWDIDDASLHRELAAGLGSYARQTEISIFGVMPREAEIRAAKKLVIASFTVVAKHLAKQHDSGLDSVVALNTIRELVIKSIQKSESADSQLVVDLIRFRQTGVATASLAERLVDPDFYYSDMYSDVRAKASGDFTAP